MYRAPICSCWRMTGNPEAEATLQRQRGLVLPNAVVTTNRLASVGKSLATREDPFPQHRYQAKFEVRFDLQITGLG